MIIIDSVIDEKEENKVLSGMRLTLDMLTISRFQNGKERTGEECWGLLRVSPTLVNLVEDHGFISEEYYLHWYDAFFGKPKAKS